MTLMLVEDNVGFRQMVKKLFEEMFSEIFETSDGEEAVIKYSAKRPDWVFMDIDIEKLNGLAATRRIKLKYPEARIVIVSQYNHPKIIKSALEAGATAYVTKDDLSKLFQIIK